LILQCQPPHCRAITARGELETLPCFFINNGNLDSARPVLTELFDIIGKNRKETDFLHLISCVPQQSGFD